MLRLSMVIHGGDDILREGAENFFHEGDLLFAIVRVEEKLACEELNQDARQRPQTNVEI